MNLFQANLFMVSYKELPFKSEIECFLLFDILCWATQYSWKKVYFMLPSKLFRMYYKYYALVVDKDWFKDRHKKRKENLLLVSDHFRRQTDLAVTQATLTTLTDPHLGFKKRINFLRPLCVILSFNKLCPDFPGLSRFIACIILFFFKIKTFRTFTVKKICKYVYM